MMKQIKDSGNNRLLSLINRGTVRSENRVIEVIHKLCPTKDDKKKEGS